MTGADDQRERMRAELARDSQMMRDGLRLAVARRSDRDATIWAAMQAGGWTLAELGAEFGVTGERVRQIAQTCRDILEGWPAPPEWTRDAGLPPRVQALVEIGHVASPKALAKIVLRGIRHAPARWSRFDLQAAATWIESAHPGLLEPDPHQQAIEALADMREAAERMAKALAVMARAAKEAAEAFVEAGGDHDA